MFLSRTIIAVLAGASVWGVTVASAFAASHRVKVQSTKSMVTSKGFKINLKPLKVVNPAVNLSHPKAAKHRKSQSGSKVSDTSENLHWLEQAINAEAGGESLRTQIAVGDVIMHRVKSGNYGGKSVYDVVFQHSNGVYQFSSVPNGHIYYKPDPSSIKAAKEVLDQKVDEVPGALVFYNPYETSPGNWVRTQRTIAQLGRLTFAV